jgi:hypothetical protein
MNTQEAIKQFQAAFETRKRDDDSKYVCTKDGTPQWIHDAIHAGHLEHFPNDLYYRQIERFADSLNEALDVDLSTLDDITEYVSDEMEPDVYTCDLTGWLHEYNDHVDYITQAIEEYGELTSGFDLLVRAQYIWMREVLDAVIGSLREAIDEDE